MKYPALVALFVGVAVFASAADPASAGNKTQEGRLCTASLLAVARSSGKVEKPPDGMRFLFLITRKPDATGNLALKETRDFLLAGESYQEKTQTELGQKFEPGTVLDSAEGFFAKQPAARKLAPEDLKDAYVLAVTIGGAKLSPDAKIEITINVGFGKEVEPFTFRATVPPGPADVPKS